MRTTDQAARRAALDLADFVDASPSPFHACETAMQRLRAAGFAEVRHLDAWPSAPGRYAVRRGGSLVAWCTQRAAGPATPFRVVGAHTDSPNLRIKPRPELASAGWQQLRVEVYGSPLLATWLDRDLGLSGRLILRSTAARHAAGGGDTDRGADRRDANGDGPAYVERLLRIDEPVLRVATLAIHLSRADESAPSSSPAQLNPQHHLTPLWGLGSVPASLRAWLADQAQVDPAEILAYDLMTHDLTPSRLVGRDADLLAAPRLDNLATCHAALVALLAATAADGPTPATAASDTPTPAPSTTPALPATPALPGIRQAVVPVLAMFDHEEVGSQSERGAASNLLPGVLERIVLAAGGDRSDYLRALAGSVVASGDMAHATHPNYPERHDPQHHVAVNAGPVLKTNVRLRYATDGLGAAAFAAACEQAGVPMQHFVARNDMPCGSTIGPVTAALTGATTVDVGAAMLSMHSARELCGADDPALYAAALAAFLAPA